MKIFVLGLCGLLLAALPAAAGDRWGDYDRQVDQGGTDGSDLDSSGMDAGLDSAGLSQGNNFSDVDTKVDWSDTNPEQDTNDLDVPPTPERQTHQYLGPAPADVASGNPVPADLSTSGKWPAAEVAPAPTTQAE